MTKPNHTGALKLVAVIIAVLMSHPGAFSGSAGLWYAVSSVNSNFKSNSVFPVTKSQTNDVLQIKCPENISTYTDINECSADLSNIPHVQVLNGTLAKLTWIMEGATEATSLPYGINQIDHYIFNEGVTIIRYSGVDYTGNTSECSFTVVISDNQAPKMSAPKSISVKCDERIPSPHTTLQAFLNAGGKASDNCNLNPNTFKLESEHKSNTGCPFTLTRTYQISDWQGNKTKVIQSISVEEMEIEVTSEEIQVLTLKSGMANTITSTAIGGNWSDGTSWVGGVAPLPDDNVIIATGAAISMTGNQVCNDISINGTLNCGGNTLQVNGSWVNNGAFNAGTGTVEFAGTSNTTLSGSSSTIFKNFRINKGAVGNILEINKNIQLGGTITFISGLMQINTGVTVNCTFNAGFIIDINAGLFINGGTFTTGAFSIDNDGLFRIDNGTANIGSSSGNGIVITSNGTFDINGGTVNVAGRLEVSGGTADISGGTINLNTVGQNSSTKGSLDLSLSSNFTMSNGIVNFLNPNGTGNFDVIMLNGVGGSKTFTGGTFNFGDGTTDTYKISSAVPFPAITSTANTNLEYKLLLTSTGTFNFPLVDNSGTAIPATVQLTGGAFSPGAFIEVKTTASKYTENKSSNNYLNRYWTVSTSGISNPVYNITATYADADISGTESEIALGSWSGSLPWFKYGNANTSTNTVAANGITATSLVFAGITSDPPTVTISATNSSICSGSSTTLTANPIGDPVFTYSWTSNPAGYTSGSQNITVSPVTTTIYTVVVTDGNGFTASDDIEITVDPISVGGTIAGSTTVCSGSNSTLLTLSGYSGNILNWQYSTNGGSTWNNISNTNETYTATNLTQTTIYRAVVQSGVCSPANSVTATITVDPVSVGGTVAGNTTVCTGINSSVLTLSGYTGNILYWEFSTDGGINWNNFSNTNTTYTATNLTQTTRYRAVVQNGVCPSANSATATITVNPVNTINLSSSDGTDAQQACLSIQITQITYATTGATGGTVTGLPTGVTGSWSANKVTISGIPSVVGTFNYTVTLSGGCGNITENGTITVNPNNTYTLTSAPGTNVQTVCVNKAITNITYLTTGATGATISGLPDGVSGSWNANTITINGTPSSNGRFDYSIELTGGCGSVAFNGTIIVTPPINASAIISDPIDCYNQTASVLITATGGTVPYRFYFQGKPSNTTGLFGGITGSVAGTVYNWSVTDSKGCAEFFGTTTVYQPEQLVASAAVSTPINCNGGTATVSITATGGSGTLSYTFNGITNTSGIFTNVVAGNNISWSVKDANNCPPVTGNITVTQPNPLSITSATVTTPIACNGGTASVTIVATGGTGTLTYTLNGVTNTTGIFTGVYAGNGLSYSVTDANNCDPVFGSLDVTQPTAITASAAVTTPITCNGQLATVTITAAGGTGALIYTFNGNSNGTGVFTNIAPGNNLQWSVKDANNCGPVSGTLNITQPNALTASVSETTSITCFGGTANIQINASGGTGVKQYTFNGVTNSTGTFTGIAAQNGIAWSVTDDNSCSVSGTYNVLQPNEIVISSITSNSPICAGSTLNLTSLATGGTGILRYNWTGPNGFIANNSQNPIILNATTAATGTYTLTVTDANNCTKTRTTDVIVNATPTINILPLTQPACHNTLTAAVNFTGADSYTWTNNNTSIGLAANGSGTSIPPFTATNTTSAPVTATITVTPTSSGCPGTPQTFTITVNPIPVATAIPDNSVYCDDPTTNIALSSNVAGTTFTWTASLLSGAATGFGPGSGSSIVQIINSDGAQIQYTITPTANGCVGSPINSVVEVVDDNVTRTLNVTGTANNITVCPGTAIQYNLASQNGNNYWIRFFWQTNNPNVGLAATGGPLNNNNGWFANVSANVPFIAINTTNVPQTANIVFTATSYRRSNNNFLCDVVTVTRTITVNPFLAVCPENYNVNASAGNCFASVVTANPTFACTPTRVTWSLTGATIANSPGIGLNYVGTSNFNVGITTVTYNALDAQGNTTTCSFTVTVTDDQLPAITGCPGTPINVPMDAGLCGAVVTWGPVTATDNCGNPTLVRTDGTGLNSGDIFSAGITTISYLTTDAAGNTSTCSFTVTVAADDQPPVITCVGNQAHCAPAGSSYTMIGTAWDATVTENCPGAVTKTYTLSGATLGTGTSLNNVEFAVGTTTVLWTATDFIGNSNTCSFSVEVTQTPAITTNPVSQAVCLNGSVSFTAAATGTPAPTFQWRKDGVDIPLAINPTLTIDPVLATDAGTYDVKISNDCGTLFSSQAVLTVSTQPVITVQPASQTDCFGGSVLFTVSATGGNLPYTYNWQMKRPSGAWIDASAEPGISFPVIGQMLVSNIGDASNPNQTQYRVIISDACITNTVTSLDATLTVNTTETLPLVTETVCQGGGTTFTVSTSGTSPVGYEWQLNGTTISNGGAYSGATTQTLTITNANLAHDGTFIARATFNITQPNNNGAGVTTCQSSFIPVGELIVDEGPDIDATPVAQNMCSGDAFTDIVITDANNAFETTYSWIRDNTTVLTGISASGNGTSISGTLTSLDHTVPQTTTFTITASTVNGCESTEQVTITVFDNVDPTVADCPGNINIGTDAGACTAVVNYTEPTFDDNCDGAGLAGTLVAGLASGSPFPVGTTTVTWEFTDEVGNGLVTCTFDVIVTDDVDPTALCKNVTVQLDAAGNATITTADIDIGSADNCGTPVLSLSKTTFDCTNLGANTVILTVIDLAGNIVTCPATVTVEDNSNPEALCKNITVQLDATGNAAITAADIDDGSNDNCGIASMSVLPNTFNCTNVGANTVVLTVTDNSGKISTCNATVNVEDNIDPNVICKDITVQLDAGGNATITAADVDNGSTDNCAIASMTLSKTSFNCADDGVNTVVLTVTDVNGNSATCNATVTIVDTQDPNAICRDITVQLDAAGNATITTTDIDDGSSDNCGTPVLSLDKTTFNCTNLGANTVVLTVTDASGNSATCSATVTVADDTNPVAINATVAQSSIDCFGGSATVTITNTGGVGMLTYTFNGVSNSTGIFTNIPAGTGYAWSITNPLGCGNVSGTFDVVQPGALSATIDFTDVTCSTNNDGTITISDVLGGSGVYEFTKDGGTTWQTSPVFTNLGPGTYNVQLRDANAPSCVHVLNSAIVVYTLSADVAHTNVSCFGGSDGTITISNPHGGSNSYDYSINGGASWENSGTYTSLIAGTYDVQIRDKNNITCVLTLDAALNVTQPAVLAATVSSTNVNCFGANDATITVSAPTGGYGTYEVSVNGTNWFVVTSGTPYIFTNLSPNNYTVQIRDAAHNSCTMNLPAQNITEPAVLSATVNSTNVNCFDAEDGTITISSPSGGSGSYEYSINGGTTWQNTGNYSALAPGTYNIQIRDVAYPACVITLNNALVITQPAILSANVSSANITCFGAADGTIIISAPSGGSGNYEYSINGGTTWQNNGNYTALAPGTYNLQIRDVAYPACIITLNTALNITQPAILSATVNSTNITCFGAVDGTITISTPTGGYGTFEYTINGGTNWQASGNFGSLLPGSYDIRIRDAANPLCEIVLNNALVISQPAELAATVSSTNVNCFGAADGTITISAPTGGSGNYEYSINGGTTWQNNGNYTALAPGTYNIQIRDVANPACVISLNNALIITQPAILSATVSSTNITCFGAANGTITILAPSGGSGNYEYSINGGTTWQNAGNYSALAPGSYNIQIRDVANPACVITLNNALYITQPAVLAATVSSTNITCFGATNGTISISAPTGGSGSYEYSINGGTTWQASGSFGPLAPGSYDVRIRDDANSACEIILNNALVISQPAALTATVSSTNVNCFGANDATITVSAPTGGYGTYEVSINGTSWFVVTPATPYTFTNLSPNNYTVQIRDAAQIGCTVNLPVQNITEPAALSATITSTNISCFGAADGTITVSAPTGGYGTYQVSINGTNWFVVTSITPYIFTNLLPNIYTVQIRDAVHTQ